MKARKSRTESPNTISHLTILIEELTKASQDKRLEMAKANCEAACRWKEDHHGKKLSDKKSNGNVDELFAVFKSAQAKVELAIVLLRASQLDESFHKKVFSLLLNALAEKMKILPDVARRDYATTQLQRAIGGQEKSGINITAHVEKLMTNVSAKYHNSLFPAHEGIVVSKVAPLVTASEGRRRQSNKSKGPT